MKKTVVITGVDGFIGSHLVKHLSHKYNIIGIDRKNNHGYRDKKGFTFLKMDINDGIPLININKEIYGVVHLAARAGVRDSHINFKEVCKDNILATQTIIRKCAEDWHPRKLLIASSSSVYGNSYRLMSEDCQLNPLSPYALSKLTCEKLLKMYKRNRYLDDIESAALRFFTVYGPNQRDDLAIQSFIYNILRDKPITVYGDGQQSRDFTYIEDVCAAIDCMLEKSNYIKKEVYNIGSGKPRSLNSVIRDISRIINKSVTIIYKEKNPFDVQKTFADISRMYNNFGWKPKTSWEVGLKRQIEWNKSNLGL